MLTVAFGRSTRSRTQVQLWYNWFKEGREDVNNDTRFDRPGSSITDETIETVKKMILDNRMTLAYRSAHAKQFIRIFYTWNMRQRRLFQKLLNLEQKQHRMEDIQGRFRFSQKCLNLWRIMDVWPSKMADIVKILYNRHVYQHNRKKKCDNQTYVTHTIWKKKLFFSHTSYIHN